MAKRNCRADATNSPEREEAFRKKGRSRKPRITIAEIAALDPPEIRLFRAQALGFDVVETAVEGTTREKFRRIESPFDHARRHGWISHHQHRSAEILGNSFAKAGLLPRVTMSWSSFVDGSGFGDGSEARDRHATKFRNAVAAIPDDYRENFLTWFIDAQSDDTSVAELGALFTVMRHKEAKKSVGILVLKNVLNHLSWHYGVSSKAKAYADD
jgi:hypothetical protein